MRLLYYLLLGGLVGGQPLFAQLNESDTLRWQLRAQATGAWQTGNVAMLAGRAKLDFLLRPHTRWAYKTQNAYLYQSFFGRKADEDGSSRHFLYFDPHRRVYPFAMYFWSSNYRRAITGRHFAGLGGTWQVWREAQHLIKLSASGAYETTHYKGDQFNLSAYQGQTQIPTWRATVWLSGKHTFAKRRIIWHYEGFVQPSLERADNWRWQAEMGVDLGLYRGWRFSVNYLYTFESLVAKSNQTQDGILTFGFSYQSHP